MIHELEYKFIQITIDILFIHLISRHERSVKPYRPSRPMAKTRRSVHRKRRQTRRRKQRGGDDYCSDKKTQGDCTSTTCGEKGKKCAWIMGGLGEKSRCECPPSFRNSIY